MFKSEEVKSMKIIPFNRDVKKWFMWKARQKENLKLYDLHKVIEEGTTIPKDGKDRYDEKELELRKQNYLVYADLMLANNDEVCFGLIDSAKTEELQEGDDKLA